MLNQLIKNQFLTFIKSSLTLSGLVAFCTACSPTVHILKPVMDESKAYSFQSHKQMILTHHPELQSTPPLQAWWEIFHDPVLNQLQNRLDQNFDYQQAVLFIRENQALLGLTQASTAPQLGLNADYQRAANSQHIPLAKLGASHHPYSLWRIGVEAAWELDLWGYYRHLDQAALATLQASYYQQQQLRLSLSAELARKYFLFRDVQQQRLLIQKKHQLDLTQLQLYQHKLQQGIINHSTLADMEIALLGSQQQELDLQQHYQQLSNEIALLLSLAPRALDQQLTQPIPLHNITSVPIGLTSDLIQTRPDILQADAVLRSHLSKIRAAQADFYPRIGLSAQLSQQALSLSDLGSWSARQFSIGPSFYLPIFQGGKLIQNLHLQEIKQQTAAIQYQQTVLNAWHEVDNALSDYQSSQQQLQVYQQRHLQQQRKYQVAQRQFQQGVVDRSAVLAEEKHFFDTQHLVTQQQYAAALSIIGLYRALGADGANQFSLQLEAKHD